MIEVRRCIHAVPLGQPCQDCYPNAREIIPDTGEIEMTDAEYAALQDRTRAMGLASNDGDA